MLDSIEFLKSIFPKEWIKSLGDEPLFHPFLQILFFGQGLSQINSIYLLAERIRQIDEIVNHAPSLINRIKTVLLFSLFKNDQIQFMGIEVFSRLPLQAIERMANSYPLDVESLLIGYVFLANEVAKIDRRYSAYGETEISGIKKIIGNNESNINSIFVLNLWLCHEW